MARRPRRPSARPGDAPAPRRTPDRSLDLAELSTGSKVVMSAGALFLVALFLPWERAPTVGVLGEAFGGDVLLGSSGTGALALVLVLGVLLWEGSVAAGRVVRLRGASPAMVTAILGLGTVVIGGVRLAGALTGILYEPAYGAWIGLIALVAVAYGTYLRFGEREARGSAPGS